MVRHCCRRKPRGKTAMKNNTYIKYVPTSDIRVHCLHQSIRPRVATTLCPKRSKTFDCGQWHTTRSCIHTHLYIEFCHVYFFFTHPRKIGFFHCYFAPRLQYKIKYNILHTPYELQDDYNTVVIGRRRRLLIIYLFRRSINTRLVYVSISENIIVDFIIGMRRVRSRPRSSVYM